MSPTKLIAGLILVLPLILLDVAVEGEVAI